jgi:hypothetical protein
MRDFQSGAILTFGILIVLIGVLELLVPSWLDAYQRIVMDLTILFGSCLIGLMVARVMSASGK